MITSPRVFWLRILVPLTVIGALADICGLLYLREANEIQSNVLDREARRTEIFSQLFKRDVRAAVQDLRNLADGDGLQAFLLSGKQADLERAIHRARFFSRQNPDYDQVRYLDEHGQEILRINANGV